MQQVEIKLNAPGFNLYRSVTCGQAFRWQEIEKEMFFGVSKEKATVIKQEKDNLVLICDKCDKEYWYNYLGLDRDYSQMEKLLAANPKTAPSLEYSKGIRIFRQDPFETLISFIISANNNVKRISKTIENICKKYGTKKSIHDIEYYAFPAPQALTDAKVEDLKECGVGYRADYIIESVKKINDGYDLNKLKTMDYHQAHKELLTFKGVGPKVAECVLLFSLGFDEAFPVDVWVKRVVGELFEFGEGEEAARQAALSFGKWAGAAQQYLFHYARQVKLGQKAKDKKGKDIDSSFS